MFLRCFYFLTKSEADVLINSVLRQNTECSPFRTIVAKYYLEQKYGNSIVVEWFMQKKFVEKPQDYIRYLV